MWWWDNFNSYNEKGYALFKINNYTPEWYVLIVCKIAVPSTNYEIAQFVDANQIKTTESLINDLHQSVYCHGLQLHTNELHEVTVPSAPPFNPYIVSSYLLLDIFELVWLLETEREVTESLPFYRYEELERKFFLIVPNIQFRWDSIEVSLKIYIILLLSFIETKLGNLYNEWPEYEIF